MTPSKAAISFCAPKNPMSIRLLLKPWLMQGDTIGAVFIDAFLEVTKFGCTPTPAVFISQVVIALVLNYFLFGPNVKLIKHE